MSCRVHVSWVVDFVSFCYFSIRFLNGLDNMLLFGFHFITEHIMQDLTIKHSVIIC